jgi:acyl-CoA thioester hydrolase
MPYHNDHRIRVRYAETDQMGVAYYANYLVWFEVGRTEYCHSCGFSYAKMERETQSYLVVTSASCRYRVPLRYDMEFVIRTRIRELRSRGLTFTYELISAAGDTVYARGETRHVVTGADGRPRSFPDSYRRLLSMGSTGHPERGSRCSDEVGSERTD